MFVFIILNLCIVFLLKIESPLNTLFLSDYSLYSGLVLLLVTFFDAALGFKKIPFKLRYDLFALGALLVWLWYWPPFFRVGSPVFYYFSLYFAFITAFCSLIFFTKREQIDPEVVIFLHWLSDSGRFNPIVIMIGVVIGLAVPQHFILFPVFITLLVTRFALACSLANE
jgi:hypothetical protein